MDTKGKEKGEGKDRKGKKGNRKERKIGKERKGKDIKGKERKKE